MVAAIGFALLSCCVPRNADVPSSDRAPEQGWRGTLEAGTTSTGAEDTGATATDDAADAETGWPAFLAEPLPPYKRPPPDPVVVPPRPTTIEEAVDRFISWLPEDLIRRTRGKPWHRHLFTVGRVPGGLDGAEDPVEDAAASFYLQRPGPLRDAFLALGLKSQFEMAELIGRLAHLKLSGKVVAPEREVARMRAEKRGAKK